MKSVSLGLISAISIAASLAMPRTAHAQTTDGAQGDDAPSATDQGPPSDAESRSQNIADIVVTANKREQKLNDVGAAVAVIGASQLKAQQISSLADLAKTIPSLSYTQTANSTPVYTLRGVGFYETSLGAYPTVSVYIDEAPLAFPATTKHSAFDLERLEVLKGPQGTLFGQNATGGAINYIAAKPTGNLTGGATVSYGRFDAATGEAYISGPLSDSLRFRLAGRAEHQGAWQISNSRPDDRNGRSTTYMGRLLLDFDPTDTIRIKLNLNGWKETGQTQAPQYIAYQPQLAAFPIPVVADAPFAKMNSRSADWTPGLPFQNNRLWQAVLRGDIDITDSITLTSLTSFVDYKQRQRDDGDGLPATSLDLTREDGAIHSFSQELRLSNSASSQFRWVIGGNYEHSIVNQFNDVQYDESTAAGLFGTALGFVNFRTSTYYSLQRMENYAAFGNAEYDIAPNLTIKAGARYTEARRRARLCTADGNQPNVPLGVGDLFYNFLYNGVAGPYEPGKCYPLNDQTETINGVAPGLPGEYASKLNEHNVSWRAGVDFKPRSGLLFYANVARGYKAGSFPAVSATTFTQFLPVVQESVTAYEVGYKATLLDRALQFNGSAFYYDYRNKQLRSKLNAPPFGILDVLQNIPKSTIKGFELEATITPVRGFTVGAAFTYLDATIDKFAGINAAGVPGIFDGTRVPFTPKYQVSLNSDYRAPISGKLDMVVGAALNLRSDTISVIGGDSPAPTANSAVYNPLRISSYALLDLRAGIASADDRWQIFVWGKNVTNAYYWNNVVSTFDTIDRYAAQPLNLWNDG